MNEELQQTDTTVNTLTGNPNLPEVFFEVSLKNHNDFQTIHIEDNTTYKFMIQVKFNGVNPGNIGRYSVRALTFKIVDLNGNESNYFFESITRKGFSGREYQFEIAVTTNESTNIGREHSMSTNIGFYNSGIIDVSVLPKLPSRKVIKNIGSHICKSRVIY